MRAQAIEQRLARSILEIGPNVAIATPEPAMWRSMELPPQARYGWTWPLSMEDNEEVDYDILVAFCPQIIDDQTANLSDDDLSSYLDVVEYQITDFVCRWFEEPDPNRRVQLVEEHVIERFPDANDLLVQVQLRALDLRLT